MQRKNVYILGIRFNEPSIHSVRTFLYSDLQHVIYTPNAEMLVFAHRDSYFREVLNRSSMNICDGSGPAYFGRLFQRTKLQRVSGTDFLQEVITVAAEHNKKVFLLGSGDTAVLETCKKLFGSAICGTHPGITLDIADTNGIHTLVYDETEMDELHHQIIMAAPNVLIVAFGHPKQELFIDAFLAEFPSVKLAMGVGGALDFYAGKAKRAPKLFRFIGLESLWRLVLEPWRWKRVFTALVIFPILYMRQYVTKKH